MSDGPGPAPAADGAPADEVIRHSAAAWERADDVAILLRRACEVP
ncbi:hypothetical protein ACWC2T_12385 [Streptomyces sp. NPDC001393]